MHLPSSVIASWHHTVVRATTHTVLPDGCRDLILKLRPGRAPQWWVTALDDRSRAARSAAGERLWGYRLHPGATLDAAALLQTIRDNPPDGVQSLLALVDSLVRVDGRTTEALQSLSAAPSVATAACSLGVSERSLQRLVLAATGRTPGYWKGLSRIRRAATALSQPVALAAIAADHGFADQAHMAREFQRWFGLPPARFRTDPVLMRTVSESGF